MAWLFTILAGLFEVLVVVGICMISIKKLFWGITLYLSSFIISLYFLHLAMRQIDMSIAYSAYTGIGVIGTVITGIIFWGESRRIMKFVYIAVIMAAIFVLKLAN